MGAVFAIELRRFGRGPMLWLLAGLLQLVLGWYCLSALESYLLMQPRLNLSGPGPDLSDWMLARYAYPGTLALIATVPPLAMQSLAGDRRDGQLSALLLAPLAPAAIAAAKFAALAVVMLGLSALIPLNLLLVSALAPIDGGALAAAWLNIAALACSAAAIGLYCSSLCSAPATAAFAATSALLLLWLIGASQSRLVGALALSELALPTHLGRALQGLLHSQDLLYYALVCTAMWALTARRLANLRLWGAR